MYTDLLEGDVVLGDNWAWTLLLTEYPISSYSLTVVFKKSSDTSISVDASETTEGFQINIDSLDAGFTDGIYYYQASVTDKTTNKRTTIGSGRIIVLPDFATSQVDPRHQDEIDLEAVEDAIRELQSDPYQEMTILGRTIKYKDIRWLTNRADELKRRINIRKGSFAFMYSGKI